MEIKGGDLHYLSMSVNGELNRQREYVQKYEKRLNVAGELDDQLGILKKLRGLQVRLRSKAFCLALPFGIGDHVFIVVQNDDGAVSFWETEIKSITIFSSESNEMQVQFYCGRGSFLLLDYEETVFRNSMDALNKCVELTEKK